MPNVSKSWPLQTSACDCVWALCRPEEIQYYMNACDICVLPYRHVTTSGAAILAFSFARPIIAPRAGDFSQLVGETRGVLYQDVGDETGRTQALQAALRQARHLDLAAANAAALALARELDWGAIARLHLKCLRTGRPAESAKD